MIIQVSQVTLSQVHQFLVFVTIKPGAPLNRF